MILLKSLHSEGLLSHDEGRRPLGFLGGIMVERGSRPDTYILE